MDILELSNTCRACLSKNLEMMDVLNEESKNIFNMFTTISGLEIVTNSPYNICTECLKKIHTSYAFREQCNNSHNYINEYIAKVNEEKKNQIQAVDIKVTEKKTLRLQQFSFEEVSQAIEESKKIINKNVKCIQCGFIGANVRALSLHMTHLHKEMKERWCAQCNGEFDNLKDHLNEHGNGLFQCQFCSKTFSSRGHYIEHLRSHAGLRPFPCDICHKSFTTSRHLKVHLRIHTNEKPYQCTFCGNTFTHFNSLRYHLKQYHNVEKQNSELKLDDGIKENKEETHAEKLITQNFCNVCKKKVKCLKMHNERIHSDYAANKTYSNQFGKLCPVCGKQFKTSNKLKIHLRTHTGEAPYKCNYCDKRVSTRNHLVVHERCHTGEKPHVCNICGKGFSQSSGLNTHMRLHTGRPEECRICNQRFCRTADLKLHMRKHTGEKPFSCSECGRAFIQRSHLTGHMQTHSDERPHKCKYCDRTFKQNSSLKTHMQIHLGHKPFKCSQCSYACRQSYRLTQHMKQHENDMPCPDRPHVCLICSRTFTTVAMLNSHNSNAHADPLIKN